MMHQSNYQEKVYEQKEPLSFMSALIRLVFGMGLSLCGSYVILQTLLKLKTFFENPEALKVFLALVPEDPKLRTVMYQGSEIILPLASFHYFSYGICVLLMMVAGMLGGSLLKRGIWLLVP